MEAQDTHVTNAGSGMPDQHGAEQSEAGMSQETDQERTENDEHSVEPPSLDLIFEVLKNSRRREAIQYLREQDEQVSLGELAEHIAAIENDTTTKQLTSSQRKRVYVGLYQCHLPKMDDIGVVEFNQNRGHVTLTEHVQHFEPYIDDTTEQESRPWHQYYAGLAGGGAGAIGTVALLGAPGWAFLLVASMLVCAVGGCALAHRAAGQ